MNSTIGFPYDFRALARLNFNHLVYFWAVVHCNGISRAARALGVAQPTVSEQVRRLEAHLGAPLLDRSAKGVRLTRAGERAMRFAADIAGIGAQIVDALPLRTAAEHPPLIIGTADAIPKLVVRRVLSLLMAADPGVRIICREWRLDHMLSELSLQRLDLVITDGPVDANTVPKLTSFFAGRSPICFLAAPALARRIRRNFPASLHNAPMGLPASGATLRRTLDAWFRQHRIKPRVVLEAEDRSHLHHFAEGGMGIIPAAQLKQQDLCRQFNLAKVGGAPALAEDYFIAMVDHDRQHPATVALRAALTSGPIITATDSTPPLLSAAPASADTPASPSTRARILRPS